MGYPRLARKFVLYFCIFCVVALMAVDTDMSKRWVAHELQHGGSSKVEWWMPLLIALSISTATSAFGAILSYPPVWYMMLSGGKEIAAIQDDRERWMCIIGLGMLAIAMFFAGYTLYSVDWISTMSVTKKTFISMLIVFGRDLFLVLGNIVIHINRRDDNGVEKVSMSISKQGPRQ